MPVIYLIRALVRHIYGYLLSLDKVFPLQIAFTKISPVFPHPLVFPLDRLRKAKPTASADPHVLLFSDFPEA